MTVLADPQSVWLVRGHYGLVGANGAEEEITTSVCETEAEADDLILRWYADGSKVEVVEYVSEDSGGSSYLCECSGIDTGRHKEWCHYLNLFRAVGGFRSAGWRREWDG